MISHKNLVPAALSCALLIPGAPSAVEAEEAKAAFVRLEPPVPLEAQPIQGEGKKRKAEVKITNNSGKSIAEVVVDMFFLKEDGTVGKSVPHTESWTLGNPEGAWDKGENEIIELNSFFMEEDTASVEGVVTSIIWKDGTRWPDWTGPAPEKEGDAPVVVKFLGLVGEGELAQVAVAIYNVGTKDISGCGYSLTYRNAEGKAIGWSNYGYFGDEEWLPVGKSAGCVGSTGLPPEETVDMEFEVSMVKFADESVWQPEK